jgi:hypothetical protein
MKTAVIGFPRIGALRELKFSSEKYFRNEITEEELLETGRTLRKTHWKIQKEAGIDYISCNDFSYYDGILDAAVMCGIIPKRYQELNLSELDTYFAMARGYQGEAGDVKALAMKKWFNTNYHYIVPEVEDDTVISFSGKKLLSEFEEAKELGLAYKVVAKEELDEATMKFARKLAAGPLLSYKNIKKQIYDAAYSDYKQWLAETEIPTQRECAASMDFQEGCKAFMEKRKAHFEGK